VVLRRLLENAVSKMDEINERSQADQLAKLTPAERERHELWEARTAALNAGTPQSELGDPRLTAGVLFGPAGEAVNGLTKFPKVRAIEDPGEWERQMLAERAARDEIRAAYLAPDRPAVRFTRVATRGRSQLREVADHLAATGLSDRPDLVYGAYRVPDLISPGRMGGEKGGIVEWDLVHAAPGPLPPASAAPAAMTLRAEDVWVDRAPGEPRPLDEDLALDVLVRAGAGPERTIAVARDVAIEKQGGGDDTGMVIAATVKGVHLLAAPGTDLGAAAQGAPYRLPPGPPDGIVVDVLQWDAIAKAVHPVRQHRQPLPSPFPYLPLTPQELLRAYIEIVGLRPGDTYSAQVTHDRPLDLMGRTSMRGGVRRTGGGPELPCADGKPRKRMAGGHHIVVAYRDAPAYAEGRDRFDAYGQQELKAHLRRGIGLRAQVPKPPNRLERTIDRVGSVVEFFTMDATAEGGSTPPRYCWPPRR
jgi:hypothetical protein